MEKLKDFLHRKDIEISVKRYGIDALGAMAQGLFCSLLIGTIINTLGTQLHIPFLTMTVATVNDTAYTVGGLASAMSGSDWLCPSLPAPCIIFPDHRRFCIQCTWRRRWSSGSSVCSSSGIRSR